MRQRLTSIGALRAMNIHRTRPLQLLNSTPPITQHLALALTNTQVLSIVSDVIVIMM